ncbi:MAG: DUF4838 domain-containing protein [Lentisphaeria bacterium]|nr:DUF4838 domain-containing protein [Lentisphaeria bacterium]
MMKWKMYCASAMLLLAMAVFAGSFPVVKDGRSVCKFTVGNGKYDSFARQEFLDLMKFVTGAVENSAAGTCNVYIGSCKETIAALGKDRIAKLRTDETLVVGKDNNLYLIGGGELGTLYAVYDFWEKYGKYRIYGEYKGAETCQKTANVIWDGKEISTYPAFDGFRTRYGGRPSTNTAKFMLRNRNNEMHSANTKLNPLYWGKYSRQFGAQHGLMLWVPAQKPLNLTHWLVLNYKGNKIKLTPWEPMFKKHPEYFSMNNKGVRIPNGQLCFSNQELRKLLTKRFRQVASLCGKGVYMVGSNDTHNVRYCFCKGCQKLMNKYQCNGGPLWDYMLELCEQIKDMPGVYVTTLIYKGWEQTEQAPVGIKFPANFIADAALLNADRVPSLKPKYKMPDGKIFDPYENLKKWCKICDHVSYWYYSNNIPAQGYQRIQKEFKELRAAGVKSVGSCGVGGGIEFSDINHYMFFQLARNPEMDAEAAVKEVVAHKYGATAEKMYQYITEAQKIHFDLLPKYKSLCGTEDTYDRYGFISGEQLAAWQKQFDEMTELVKNDPRTARNVRIARIGLDCWTIVYAARIRKACPDYKFDAKAVLKRSLAACTEAEKAGMIMKNQNLARKSLESLEYYAELKDTSLPKELTSYDPLKVHLYLPERPMPYAQKTHALYPDEKAAAGVAMQYIFKPNKNGRISVEYHDYGIRQWLPLNKKGIDSRLLNAEKYTMVKLGRARLPRLSMLVLANGWGSSLDIRSLGRFYDPSYHERIFEYWASCRLLDAPAGKKHLLVDRVYLVEIGMPHELEQAERNRINTLAIPPELASVPKENIMQWVPVQDTKGTVADPDAVSGFARKRVFTGKVPTVLGVNYRMPREANKWGRGNKIVLNTLTPGKYQLVKYGTNKVFKDIQVVLNGDWGGPLDFRGTGAFVPVEGERYTLYFSVKVDGPKFFKDSKSKENYVAVDRLIFVKEK